MPFSSEAKNAPNAVARPVTPPPPLFKTEQLPFPLFPHSDPMDPPDQDQARKLLQSVFAIALDLELARLGQIVDRTLERKPAPSEPSSAPNSHLTL